MSRGSMSGQQWRDQQEYSYFPTPPIEPTIDRDPEFDQTARSDERSETPGPRAVSPSILEHRILMLKQELRVANADRVDLAERLRVATERIAGFEKMAGVMAGRIDEMMDTFKTLTGTTPAEVAPRI